MSSAKYLLAAVVAVTVVGLFSVCEVSGDDSVPSKCDPPCQQLPLPDPPLSGNPSSGDPAPPPPSGYSIYGDPPPPAHKEKGSGQTKCPPASPQVQCCNPPYPYYTYAPPNAYPYAPPNTYPYGPPSPYTYMPYGEGGRLLVPILAPLMMMVSSSFIFFI